MSWLLSLATESLNSVFEEQDVDSQDYGLHVQDETNAIQGTRSSAKRRGAASDSEENFSASKINSIFSTVMPSNPNGQRHKRTC